MKKIFTLVIVLAVIRALAPLPLAARERRGSTVEVTLADGFRFKGELLSVKSDDILVYSHDTGVGKSFALHEVDRVTVFKKSRILAGMGIGLGVGLVITYRRPDWHRLDWISFLGSLPVASALGGLAGVVFSTPRILSFAGGAAEDAQRNLERLARYARERSPARLVDCEK